MNFKLIKSFCLLLFLRVLTLQAVPDLTIVGFFEPEGGIGKVPVTIIETLGDRVSANFVQSSCVTPAPGSLPASVMKVLQNRDSTPGKVALLTDLICDRARDLFSSIPKESTIKLAYSMLETSRIPNRWVTNLNHNYDAVIVPDPYLKTVYQNSGVQIPVFVLPMPMVLSPYLNHPLHPEFSFVPFTFMDASANKNPAVLVKAFAKAFGNNSAVYLLLRAKTITPETRQKINNLVAHYGLTNVAIEDGNFSEDQWIQRLKSCDCYVNLSRGEGFSLIPREALALGIPVIITDNTASSTICNSGHVRAVPSTIKNPANFQYGIFFQDDCGEQFDCDVEDAKDALLDVYHNYRTYITKAREGRQWVLQYNSENPKLQEQYLALIKPKEVILGEENHVTNGVLTTNSHSLLHEISINHRMND